MFIVDILTDIEEILGDMDETLELLEHKLADVKETDNIKAIKEQVRKIQIIRNELYEFLDNLRTME